jgi:hypothetical protein
MAKVRRKSNGARRGAFKQKKMGKGWASHKGKLERHYPVENKAPAAEGESEAKPAAS